MPFGRDTRVVPSNIVLDRGPDPYTRRADLGGRNSQFTAMPPNAKLLCLFNCLLFRSYSSLGRLHKENLWRMLQRVLQVIKSDIFFKQKMFRFCVMAN